METSTPGTISSEILNEVLPPLSREWLDPPLAVSQWADECRVLSEITSAEPGKWSTARTPYLKEPMDAFSDPFVEEVVMRCAVQVGKTETILNCVGFVIANDPAPTLVVLPRDEDAKNWGNRRIKPMVIESPNLKRHTTGKEDDLAGKIYTFDRMMLKLGGANSPNDLSGDPCRYVFMDEVDKYPRFSGRESDPVSMAKKRATTYWDRKIMMTSTPTLPTGYISQAYEDTDKRVFYVPCPHCHRYQPLWFSKVEDPVTKIVSGRVVWNKGMTPEEIRDTNEVWYECARCKERIGEEHKADMLERGVWVPEGQTVTKQGKLKGTPKRTTKRGYHISALYSPWVRWAEVVAEFLESKDDPAKLMAFVNQVLAEPWIERKRATKKDDLKKRMGRYPMGQVPEAAQVLTAGVDVQADHYVYGIRAWGVGEESWLIRNGTVESDAELISILFNTLYPKESGHVTLPVRLACIDSGHRTDEIYALCRVYLERLRPTKGQQSLSGSPLRVSHLEKNAAGQTIKGGLSLWNIDTNFYKDKLSRLIHVQEGDPGEWHLHRDVDDTYLDQLLAEQKTLHRDKRTGHVTEVWEQVGNRANHYLDVEVLALAAADMLKVYNLREPGQAQVYQPRRESSWLRAHGREEEVPQGRRGGWLRR